MIEHLLISWGGFGAALLLVSLVVGRTIYRAPRGVWIAIICLSALSAAGAVTIGLQHHDTATEAMSSALGAFMGGVLGLWLWWALFKGIFLACRKAVRAMKAA
jgi:hypothetical protein